MALTKSTAPTYSRPTLPMTGSSFQGRGSRA
jgi:hypothetical protein